ncbi:MAG: GAF domain-containing protein [Bryobacterales bacterium]|nr:GAF domain-containing protein [Bryobacterales bacterium]
MPEPTNELPITDSILEDVTPCLNELALVLADPYGKPDMDTFADAVKRATGAEAVSVFTPAGDNPHILVPAGAVGYSRPYREHTYLLSQPALTTHVYRSRQSINMSRKELERTDSKVPYSGACDYYIESGRFYNLIATPILYGYSPTSAKCLGVLKLENQGQDPERPFRPESFALARILAEVIAIALEQRRVAGLWNQAEKAWLHRSHRNLASYRETVAELARKLLDAERVALYRATVRGDGSAVLRYDVGFRKERAHLDYELAANPLQNRSILPQTARQVIDRDWDAAGVARLAADPFIRECLEELGGALPRSLLIFSVRNDKELLGALAVVNKAGEKTTFDVLDRQGCRAFTQRHIVPYLVSSGKPAESAEPSGFDKLVEKFGSYQPLKSIQLFRRIQEIEEFRQAQHITAHECAAYFGLKRENYLNKVRKTRHMFGAA